MEQHPPPSYSWCPFSEGFEKPLKTKLWSQAWGGCICERPHIWFDFNPGCLCNVYVLTYVFVCFCIIFICGMLMGPGLARHVSLLFSGFPSFRESPSPHCTTHLHLFCFSLCSFLHFPNVPPFLPSLCFSVVFPSTAFVTFPAGF